MTTTATYPLAPEEAASAATDATDPTLPNQQASVADRGLLLPFQRNQRSDFANGTGDALLIARVQLLLGTRGPSAQSGGEVWWRPNDGASLHALRHQNNTEVLRAGARAYIVEAFRRSLPTVRLREILSIAPKGNVIDLTIVVGTQQGASSERVVELPVSIQSA